MTSERSPALLFDRAAWRMHRDRAARQGSVDFLHQEAGERLIDRLDLIEGEFPSVLDLGAGGGIGTRLLAARPGTDRIVAADPALPFLAPGASGRIVLDPEFLPFADASFDLIASVLLLHWSGDLPGALVQIRRALKPGGLFMAAMFGGQTLIELRTALFEAELAEEGGVSPRVSPAIELSDAAGLLQRAGFTSPVADSETITVTYPGPVALMRELRAMGETNALAARRRGFMRRATIARATQIYADRFAEPDRRVRATFEILLLTARAPDPALPPRRRATSR